MSQTCQTDTNTLLLPLNAKHLLGAFHLLGSSLSRTTSILWFQLTMTPAPHTQTHLPLCPMLLTTWRTIPLAEKEIQSASRESVRLRLANRLGTLVQGRRLSRTFNLNSSPSVHRPPASRMRHANVIMTIRVRTALGSLVVSLFTGCNSLRSGLYALPLESRVLARRILYFARILQLIL